MGHQVGYKHRPHRGSLGYWPRKRAKRQYPRVNWKQGDSLMGFPGYKAGMTHLIVIDNRKNSTTKGKKLFMPVTILETPPVRVIGVKFYKKTVYGVKAVSEVLIKEFNKELKRKIKQPKKEPKKIDEIKGYDDIRLIVQTQPKLIKLKKTPEVFELGIGGGLEEKVAKAKELLGKEVRVNEVLKEGMQVDACAVTKGKGTQGSVKRHGVRIRQHKSEKTKRAAGSLGPESPRWVSWRVPQFGQLGYHKRTEFNKLIIKIGEKPEEINPKGGIINYGLVKGEYLLIKGTIPGPRKRMICLRQAVRPSKTVPKVPPQIVYTNQLSQQGVRLT